MQEFTCNLYLEARISEHKYTPMDWEMFSYKWSGVIQHTVARYYSGQGTEIWLGNSATVVTK
jgi:hypothetical protein